jgi:hypothetical protein
MDWHDVMSEFFQRVAVGAVAALSLLVIVRWRMPRRSQVKVPSERH